MFWTGRLRLPSLDLHVARQALHLPLLSDVSYNPELHDRMKHVERRHFFVRDMVERFELEVPYVSTVDNIADFFTKSMHSCTRRSSSSPFAASS